MRCGIMLRIKVRKEAGENGFIERLSDFRLAKKNVQLKILVNVFKKMTSNTGTWLNKNKIDTAILYRNKPFYDLR